MKNIVFLLIFAGHCVFNFCFAQKKIVVMGSSTAAGAAATSGDSSWAGRLQSYVRRNIDPSDPDTIVINIAAYGYTTYHEMPTGFISLLPGRPLPDANYNITKALSFNPDIVIINLPTNDVSALDYPGQTPPYNMKETMDNFRRMYLAVASSGAQCYITTTQPRNDLTNAQRLELRNLVDSIKNNFGISFINFWTDLVTPDGTNRLKDEVRHLGFSDSLYHLNNYGHRLLFQRVLSSPVFASNTPLTLILNTFAAHLETNGVLIKWTTEQEDQNSLFELQRSPDNLNYETFLKQQANGKNHKGEYSRTDLEPLAGNNFYRLKITEPNKTSYSRIADIFYTKKPIVITRVYLNSSGLHAEVNSRMNQPAELNIITITGRIIVKQRIQLSSVTRLDVPVSNLARGYYIVRVINADGNYDSGQFTKIK